MSETAKKVSLLTEVPGQNGSFRADFLLKKG